MTDAELTLNVSEELLWDPKIDGEAIAVSTDAGHVTLRGTVGSFRQKREARKAAERVRGVLSVHNELEVRILNDAARDDADLRGDVLQALMLDSLVPTGVDAHVHRGVVTLRGSADGQYQRNEAEFIAGNVAGVTGVQDEIKLENPAAHPSEIEDDIQRALIRDANLDAEDIVVATIDGNVTLSGEVHSWSEHDAALAAAWAAPGIKAVDDQLTVTY